MRRLSLNRSEPAKKSGRNIPKNRCRTTVAEPIGGNASGLPFTADQVGLFRAQPGHLKRTCNPPKRDNSIWRCTTLCTLVLFCLYPIYVVDNGKNSCSDYRLPIKNRIDKIGRNRIASRKWWCRISMAPNRHSTVTMSFNLFSPINYTVDVAKRKRSVILLGDHCETGRLC